VGYATPKVEVRGAVVRDNQILLVREREDGGWTMPGGWADVGESPTAMVVREVKEESGFDVAPRKLAAVFDRNKHPHPPIPSHAYKLYFLCELLGGEITPSFETPEVGFFARNALPPLSAPRITAYQIEHMFEHAEHPEWPTTFD
jgi:ADP-ribose pyrophosphatase YjhB (NUDIX family)